VSASIVVDEGSATHPEAAIYQEASDPASLVLGVVCPAPADRPPRERGVVRPLITHGAVTHADARPCLSRNAGLHTNGATAAITASGQGCTANSPPLNGQRDWADDTQRLLHGRAKLGVPDRPPGKAAHTAAADGLRVASARRKPRGPRASSPGSGTASSSSGTSPSRSTCGGSTSSPPASGLRYEERAARRTVAGRRLPGDNHGLLDLDGGDRRAPRPTCSAARSTAATASRPDRTGRLRRTCPASATKRAGRRLYGSPSGHRHLPRHIGRGAIEVRPAHRALEVNAKSADIARPAWWARPSET